MENIERLVRRVPPTIRRQFTWPFQSGNFIRSLHLDDRGLLFGRNLVFDPKTGVVIETRIGHHRRPAEAREAREVHRHFGFFWGPLSTVLGGALTVVYGGPVGWVVGGITIIGGFSWGANDVQSELNYHGQKGAPTTPPSSGGGTGGGPSHPSDGGAAAGAEFKPDKPEHPADDGGSPKVEYIEFDTDFEVNNGELLAPDQDLGLGPSNIPPGVVRIHGGGATSMPTPDGTGPAGPTSLPTPDGGGPQGPLSRRPWIAMPLYYPTPDGGGPEGPLSAPPIAGYISFYKA